jgi:protein-disulfide isomerase
VTQQQRNLFVLALLVLAIFGGLLVFSSNRQSTPTDTASDVLTVTYTTADGTQQVILLRKISTEVLTGARFVTGSSDAKNSVVEFADYQCPACGIFAAKTESLLEKEFIETGKVRYAFRDFPLPQHQNAKIAAQAAACANEQGRYELFKDILFRGQAAWSSSLESVVKKQFGEYAAASGVNLARFTDCLSSNNAAEAVAQDMALASQIGVTSTPSFVVNGYLFAGALPIEAFRAILDKVGQ